MQDLFKTIKRCGISRLGVVAGILRTANKLCKEFTGKKIGDCWVTLPDDSRIVVAPDSQITITLRGGKPVNFISIHLLGEPSMSKIAAADGDLRRR
jgi:hypothetical protein